VRWSENGPTGVSAYRDRYGKSRSLDELERDCKNRKRELKAQAKRLSHSIVCEPRENQIERAAATAISVHKCELGLGEREGKVTKIQRQ
jgi:hypothetical protein